MSHYTSLFFTYFVTEGSSLLHSGVNSVSVHTAIYKVVKCASINTYIWVMKDLSHLESWSCIRLELLSKTSKMKKRSRSSSTVLPSLLFLSLVVWITLCFRTSIYTPYTYVSSRYSRDGRGKHWRVFGGLERKEAAAWHHSFCLSSDLPFSAPLGMTLKNKILTYKMTKSEGRRVRWEQEERWERRQKEEKKVIVTDRPAYAHLTPLHQHYCCVNT